MARRSRVRRLAATLLASISLALVGLPATALAVDATPPTGTAEVADYHPADETIEFQFTFSDPESGLATIAISCDGGPEATYPYDADLTIKGMEPAAGGCTTFGAHTFQARVINGDGLETVVQIAAYTSPVVRFTYPLPARTGELFTIRPTYSEGFTPPPTAVCRWEFRWGSTTALRDNEFDETFGGMLFEGPASQGFCGEWTFTLPWVPVPQFEISFDGPASSVRSGIWPDREIVHATVAGTDRRIYQSNLPVAQVLPSTYTPTVGQPVTYTRYLIGGATACCNARWSARLGSGERPTVWEKWTTSSTFTITPPTSGDLFVGWDRENATSLLAAYYDPPVRTRDSSPPNTTAPAQKVGGALLGSTVPVTLTWTGTDRGWGIGSYKLQQSVNGGAWTTIRLPSAKTTSVIRMVTPGTAVRYRVQATDKAGNIGSWDYGPTFKPSVAKEANSAVTYAGSWTTFADPTAEGGYLRESTSAGARATFTFTGRDVGWFAEKGPNHGSAKVYIDGVLAATIDLKASVDQPRRIVYRRHWSSVGSHTLRIVVSGNGVVDVDAFVVLR